MSSDSPTPGELPPGRLPAGNPASGAERAALEAARQELEASRRQINELEGLLHDLPAIFERKFGERIEPLLERQRLLLADNQALQDRLSRLLPQGGETGAPAPGPPTEPAVSAEPADAAAPPPASDSQAAAPTIPGEPSLPALPQLRRSRAATSRLMGQNGRVA